MATAVSKDQVARALLDHFKSVNARAGRVLQGNNIVAFQVAHGFTSDELMAGLQYAGDKGWIDSLPSSAIKLTEAGFAAM